MSTPDFSNNPEYTVQYGQLTEIKFPVWNNTTNKFNRYNEVTKYFCELPLKNQAVELKEGETVIEEAGQPDHLYLKLLCEDTLDLKTGTVNSYAVFNDGNTAVHTAKTITFTATETTIALVVTKINTDLNTALSTTGIVYATTTTSETEELINISSNLTGYRSRVTVSAGLSDSCLYELFETTDTFTDYGNNGTLTTSDDGKAYIESTKDLSAGSLSLDGQDIQILIDDVEEEFIQFQIKMNR